MLQAAVLCLLLAQAQSTADLAEIARSAERDVKVQSTAGNWQKLGLARFMQNRFPDAIGAFRQAIARDAGLWPSQLFLGMSLYRTNRFEEALHSLKTARQLAPPRAQGSDDIDYWLGATYLALKQPWSGVRSLEHLLARTPGHKDALAMLAKSYADLSGSLWNDVAERYFDTPPGQEVHGHALEADHNYTDALAAYERSESMAPDRPGPGLEIGRVLLQQGKTAEGLAALKREQALNPRDPETLYFLALAYIQSNHPADALPLLRQSYAGDSNDSEAALALAQVLLALKRPSEAIGPAKRAAVLDPSSVVARELLAAALAQAALPRERSQ